MNSLQALVLAEEVADLAAAHVDVARRHVGELADVALQLGHERLAEAHHFGVGTALRVEVGAALATAHRQAGERVLQDLLEAQELDHAFGDGGVEAQAALVRADRGIELHAVAAVHLHVAVVVDPSHAELDQTLRLHETLQHAGRLVFRMLCEHRLDALEHFLHCLQELGLVRVAFFDLRVHALHILIGEHCSSFWCVDKTASF